MDNIENNIDEFYRQEFESNHSHYIQLVRKKAKEDSVLSNSYLKNEMMNELIKLKNSLFTISKNNSIVEDPFFKALVNDTTNIERKYQNKPLQCFFERDFEELKNEFKHKKPKIRPEIYKLDVTETIKLLAKYNAIEKALKKLININWRNEQTLEQCLLNFEDENYYEACIDYGVLLGYKKNNDDQNNDTPCNTKTSKVYASSYALVYYILSEVDIKQYPVSDHHLKKFFEGKDIENFNSFRTAFYDVKKRINDYSEKTISDAYRIIKGYNNSVTIVNKFKEMTRKNKYSKDL